METIKGKNQPAFDKKSEEEVQYSTKLRFEVMKVWK